MKPYKIEPISRKECEDGGFVVNKSYPSQTWAIYYNDKVHGVFGFLYTKDGPMAFSDQKKSIKAPLLLKWRAIKECFSILCARHDIFFAVSSAKHHNSGKMLSALGMFPIVEKEGVRVYLWRTH